MTTTYRRRSVDEIRDAVSRLTDVATGQAKPDAAPIKTFPPRNTDVDVILSDAIAEIEELRRMEMRYTESLWEDNEKRGRC